MTELAALLSPHQARWSELTARLVKRSELRVQRSELDMVIAEHDVAIDQMTARLYDALVVDVIRSGK